MSSSTPAARGPTARIAIASQEEQIGRLIALTLRLEGYVPHLLLGTEPALDTLLREPYAAAIVDTQLAPVDGYTICRRVRAATHTPVILMLMRDDAPGRIRAQREGASGLLSLPFTVNELLACVRDALCPTMDSPADQQRATPPKDDANKAE